MTFSDFIDIEFPLNPDIVYVLYFRKKNDSKETFFYVRQSSRNIGRFGDYVKAGFAAPTDFKVGEAIRHLRKLGCFVGVKYKVSSNRKVEEKDIMQALEKSYKLLNDLDGYDYKKADENNERLKVHTFINKIYEESGAKAI